MTHTYRFAEQIVEIHAMYPDVYALCADYRTEGRADFSVSTTPRHIAFEREKSAREDAAAHRAVREYGDGYLETLAVYRMIAEKMPDYDTFLFHGSCIAVDGAGYLFTAKSGIGKSTHARLWRELLGDRAVMVNDDKPLIRVSGGSVLVYGTPWDGKHNLSNNVAVPLRAVCVLEQAAENRIRETAPGEALPTLIQQAYRPMDPAALSKTLPLIDRLAGSVKLYRLACNMDLSAAELSYHTMSGG